MNPTFFGFPHFCCTSTSTPPQELPSTSPSRRLPVLFASSAVSVAGAPQLGVYSAKARALEALCAKAATRRKLEIGCVALLAPLVA